MPKASKTFTFPFRIQNRNHAPSAADIKVCVEMLVLETNTPEGAYNAKVGDQGYDGKVFFIPIELTGLAAMPDVEQRSVIWT